MTVTSRSRVLVTGGASGLGAAVAERCRDAGHHVVVIDRVESEHETILTDIADVPATSAAVAEAVRRLGGLDALVTAAGINKPAFVEDVDPEVAARIVEVNLIGTITATIAAVPPLLESHGRAIFIGSTVTRRGNAGHAAYAATKHGLAGFVHSLGYEVRGRMGLTIVEPGAMDTALFKDRPAEWDPPQDLKMPVGVVGDAVMYALSQPAGISVRELLITADGAPDWP